MPMPPCGMLNGTVANILNMHATHSVKRLARSALCQATKSDHEPESGAKGEALSQHSVILVLQQKLCYLGPKALR